MEFKNKLDFDIHIETCNCKYMCVSCHKVFKQHLSFVKDSNICQTMKLYFTKC